MGADSALLVDLSVTGAQVMSIAPLRPNQRVPVVLVADARPVHLRGTVRWCSLELTARGPRYRAGVEFAETDPDGVRRFFDTNGRHT